MTAATRKALRPVNRAPSSKRTSVCLPEAMRAEIETTMTKQGVSTKRRSQWIERAITDLHEQPSFGELVLEEFIEPGRNVTIPVTLSITVKQLVDDTAEVLTESTGRAVERSSVIRTAISQALIRNWGAR